MTHTPRGQACWTYSPASRCRCRQYPLGCSSPSEAPLHTSHQSAQDTNPCVKEQPGIYPQRTIALRGKQPRCHIYQKIENKKAIPKPARNFHTYWKHLKYTKEQFLDTSIFTAFKNYRASPNFPDRYFKNDVHNPINV